ncbi:E3 ubiquitin-protein ligase synoviolin [Cariama cristata]
MLCTAVVMAGSLALTTAVVAHAYYLKHQFYPTVVYLTKSSPSMAVLYIQAFVLVFLLGKFMGKVFFGQLRAAEMEHLLERSWYAVTETCLAFTVFRDDFSPRFVALFTLLLFLKCFHWLAEDRVDFMERSPNISWLFHFRIVCECFGFVHPGPDPARPPALCRWGRCRQLVRKDNFGDAFAYDPGQGEEPGATERVTIGA